MAPDPKQEADAYMQKHQLGHLFEVGALLPGGAPCKAML